jgi:hypothetical protein|tara:strand:+ start:5890 stop:6123 length:234 start_codon:yes stop_codon:yes gene_type:complete
MEKYEMALDKLTYSRGIKSKEPQIIEFSIPTDLSIQEYKRTCKRLAQALGYSTQNIEEYFGKDVDKGNPNQLKLLFD